MSSKTKVFLQYLIYSILFILVSYMVFRFFPENNKFLINHADTWRQYIKAVAYNSKWMRGFIYHLFKEKSLLPQTLSYGMGYGNDIYPTLQYYAIGDILNIPSVFVKTEYIYIYIQITTVLRAYLAGIAISLYLRYIRPELSWISVMCGMFTYSFGSYFMYYGTWHPYFANPLIYMPLVLLGAEKIFKEKKPLTFIIAIFLSGINNFYFFYLIVLLTVIYCIVRALFLYGKNLSELMGNVEWSQITKCQVDSEHDMREMQDYLERQWLFYPQPTNPTFYERYPIRTLMMFLVYLPLMDWEKILRISWRICGCLFEQEVYVLTQLWELYEGIPDGKAKRYADYAARKCTYNFFYAYYTSDHAETDSIIEEFGSIEKMQECFAEYRSIIENRWYSAGGPKLYREDELRKALRESE